MSDKQVSSELDWRVEWGHKCDEVMALHVQLAELTRDRDETREKSALTGAEAHTLNSYRRAAEAELTALRAKLAALEGDGWVSAE